MSVRRLTGGCANRQGSDRKGPAPSGAPLPSLLQGAAIWNSGAPGAELINRADGARLDLARHPEVLARAKARSRASSTRYGARASKDLDLSGRRPSRRAYRRAPQGDGSRL